MEPGFRYIWKIQVSSACMGEEGDASLRQGFRVKGQVVINEGGDEVVPMVVAFLHSQLHF